MSDMQDAINEEIDQCRRTVSQYQSELDDMNGTLEKLRRIYDELTSSRCMVNLCSTRDSIKSFTPHSQWTGDRKDDFISARDTAQGNCSDYIKGLQDIGNRVYKKIQELNDNTALLQLQIFATNASISSLQASASALSLLG
ncbi:MAG: DUF5082 family protein [Olsenella sp.]|jgi:uncharacterized protein YukE|nr:DUF5082 family protein [Olsenella sp.]